MTAFYEIRLRGHLHGKVAEQFDGLSVTNQPDGQAVLRGLIPDQAALHGVLARVRDLGLPLVSLNQLEPTGDDPSRASVIQKGDKPMNNTLNKIAVRRIFEEVFNQNNEASANELIASEYHGQYVDEETGPRNFVGFMNVMRESFPDLHFEVFDLIEEDNKVVASWVVTATQRGDFLGMPATNKAIKAKGVTVMRMVNGQWAEGWGNWDVLGVLQQIGAMPSFESQEG